MKDFARIYFLGDKWVADYLNKTYAFLAHMPLHEVESVFSKKGIPTVREWDKDSERP